MKPLDLENARVLVTGGAGFLGSALVWGLNRRGCEDIVIADFLGHTEKWKNLAPLHFHDYLEADQLFASLQALGRFDLILHLGACSATTETDAAYLIHNNYEFTRDLAAHALGADSRFVYASSAATYGDGSAGMSDRETQLHRFRPLNVYGYSKHLFDLYAQRHGFLEEIVGLKYFNVFGPNEHHKEDMRSLVHKAYGQALESGTIRLFKSHRSDYRDGEQMRDFLYVKDAVAMTLHLACAPEAGGLFNLGSGTAHTWIQLATAVFEALDRPPSIEFIDMPETIRDKYQYYTCADIDRLRQAGYADPVTPLEAAVEDYIRHYLAHGRHLGDEPSEDRPPASG